MNPPVQFDEIETPSTGLLTNLPTILSQRRWWIAVPAAVGLLCAVLALLLIPSTYRSSALMLVQSQQLPDDITGQMGAEIVDRRLARIRQQVTSRPDLISLMERNGLYNRERANNPLSEIIKKMRKAINLTPTTADLPGDRADERMVAFEVSFDYSDPVVAQAVAQELMQRIVELDSSGKAEQAEYTVQFLTEQAKGLEDQIAGIQKQISGVTARNGRVLSTGGVTMLGGNTASYDVQIATLQRDNASLVAQRTNAATSNIRDPVVQAAETHLASARAIYSENHPDVILAKQRLAEARELAKSNTEKQPVAMIDQQITFNNSQIASLRAAKASEQSQISTQLNAQAQAPLVQQEIAGLDQRLTGLNEQYQKVSARLLAARAGVRAEDEQMGQRLAVIDPPIVPDKPVFPSIFIFLLAGLGGGLGLGLAIAIGTELAIRPIRDSDAVAATTGQAPLGVIPHIARRDKTTGRGRTGWPWLRLFGRRAGGGWWKLR